MPPDIPATASPNLSRTPKRRSIWFQLHLWIGWIAALPIALVCLTGALLVFETDLFKWEHAELYQLETSGTPLSVQEVLEGYRSANPPLQVNHLGLPTEPEHAYSAYCMERRPEGNRGARVFMNPYTGELIHQSDQQSVSHFIVDLHRHLAAGKIGQQIVAFSSLALAVTGSIGLVLWWPLRGNTFKRAWRRGAALDWHNALGLIALMPLIVMALTGITFTWGKHIWPLLDQVQGQPSEAIAPAVIIEPGAEKVSMNRIVEQVRAEYPDQRITGIQPGNSEKSPVKVFLDANGNNLQLVLNPYTGVVLSRIDGSGTGPVGWYRRYFGKFHTLGSYGLTVRIAWGLFSLGGSVLVVTGLWISIKRWRRPKPNRLK